MKRPWPRIPIIVHAPRGVVRTFMLVAFLTALAGLFQISFGDIDEFENRTGLFGAIGTFIIDGIVALVAFFSGLWAIAAFFPRRWGEKAGVGSAIFAAVICAFCLRVLWLGGAGD